MCVGVCLFVLFFLCNAMNMNCCLRLFSGCVLFVCSFYGGCCFSCRLLAWVLFRMCFVHTDVVSLGRRFACQLFAFVLVLFRLAVVYLLFASLVFCSLGFASLVFCSPGLCFAFVLFRVSFVSLVCCFALVKIRLSPSSSSFLP